MACIHLSYEILIILFQQNGFRPCNYIIFSFGNTNDAEETREYYLELLENELQRGPVNTIVEIVTKMLKNCNGMPEAVQNAAIVCLG